MVKINLFNLIAKLSLNDDDYKKGLDNAKGGAEGLGGTFKKVGGIIATVFAVDKIKDFTSSVVKMGIEYNASIEQSTVAWKTLLGSQEKAEVMIKDIAKYAATTPFSKMGVDEMAKQLHNAGFKGDELFKQLTKFGDMGGAFGVQEDSLKEMVRQYAQVQMATVAYTEDLNILQDRGIPIYKGLSEVLGKSVADVKKMASEGKISADIYNKAIDSIAKNTEGSMVAQSKTFNGMISTLKDNLGVLAGKLAEPIFNKLLEQLPKVMDFLDKLISNIGEGQGFLEGFANAIEDTFGESAANKVRVFTNTLSFIMDNINGIATALVGVATGMAVFKTVNLVMGMVKAFKAWRVATEGMTIAQALLNVVMTLNPIGIIIGLIAGLVAALIYLWNTNDGFRNALINAWNAIKEVALDCWGEICKFFTEDIPNAWNFVVEETGKLIDSIVNWFSQLPNRIWTWLVNTYKKIEEWGSKVWEKAKEIGKNFITSFMDWITQLPQKIWLTFLNALDKVAQFAINLGSKALEAGKNMVNNIINAVKSLPSEMMNIGRNIVEGVWNGISNMGGWIMGKVKGFFGNIVNGAKSMLGIHSPSRVFADEVGKYMAEGVGVGFEDEISSVNATVGKSLETTVIQPNRKTEEQEKNNLVFYEMLTTLKGILNKDTIIELEGREVARGIAPYQNEFTEYDRRNPKFAY